MRTGPHFWMAPCSPICHARRCRSRRCICPFSKIGLAICVAATDSTIIRLRKQRKNIATSSRGTRWQRRRLKKHSARNIRTGTQRWLRSSRDHIRQRGWKNTNYLVYFNNKYYWKRPSQGGRGISWWLLDEPNHRDDVRANSFLAYLTKRNLDKYPDVPILLRTDISRVEWIRDLMAGQIDLNCISKRFFDKNRYLQDDRYRFGKEYWNYASTNHPRDTNVSMRAWCWRVWLNGGDGLLPWNAVRGAAAWDRAEPLTVFYPGTKFGKNEPFGSLRLKAYRRGQQDIEYLMLLAQQRGWDRDAVTVAMGKALDLSGTVDATSEEDAGTVGFRNVKDAQLDEFRLRAAQAVR